MNDNSIELKVQLIKIILNYKCLGGMINGK